MNKPIDISGMALSEKVAQLIIVRGEVFLPDFIEMGIGGIFLAKQHTKEDYIRLIARYQQKSKIPLFVSTDLEGYLNPFKTFYETKPFFDVKTSKESYALGTSHGKLLVEMGFNYNFSPVVELENNVWPGRTFTGSFDEISDNIRWYIKGLQERGIIATAKHYPGKSLVQDPHLIKYEAKISETDLTMFHVAIDSGVKSIMVGHPIVYGAVDSEGMQGTLSKKLHSQLREVFDGIIITDAVTMNCLKESYKHNFDDLYVDLLIAGNDIILDTDVTSATVENIRRRIATIVKAIEENRLSENQIDESLKRVLLMKGFDVAL